MSASLREFRDFGQGFVPFAGIAAGLAAMGPLDAKAQESVAPGNLDLPTLVVEGGAPINSLEAPTGLGRLPGTVQSTPQIVQTVPQIVLQQQGVTSLEQALRNVPGVTAAIGEGNGGLNGDQFRIRGLDAKGDIYVDGLRDFGSYVRDSFNMESVQVFKGPSSESFGMGTTGGAINTQLKQAGLGDFYSAEGSIGTGPLYRSVIDINKQFGDSTAFRITAMGTRQDVADRDHVKNDRWGISLGAGIGLGTDQTWNLNYTHLQGERTPDYGVPFVTRPGATIGYPVTEHGVPRNIYYGKATDQDKYTADIFTSKFRKLLNEHLTVFNDTRIAYYTRDFQTSVPGCNAACSTAFFAGADPALTYGGGNPSYDQRTFGAQTITTLQAKFRTGWLRHELVAGFDFFGQHDNRRAKSTVAVPGTAGKVPPTIRTANYYDTASYYLTPNFNNIKRSQSSGVAAFASDRIWLTEQFSILGGIRYDRYYSSYNTFNGTRWTETTAESVFFSPKVSAIFEPTKNQTYYVSYATSASPPGQFVSLAPTVVNAAQPNLEPEKNQSIEAGAKINVLDGRLGLTAAVFQINKNNSHYIDPITGDAVATGEKQRVRGLELGATGQITDQWTINAAYSYIDAKITSGANLGNRVGNAPEHSGSLWTSYDVAPHFAIPGKLLIGGGFSYQSEVFTASANTYKVPSTFSLDALISYEYENYRVALNAYNLTDELNYSGTFNARAIPTSGRTFVLTAGVKF